MRNKILQGDVLEVLRTLPNELVNCVVTSPPYWGLRDYGTGQWNDGDPNCEHFADTLKHSKSTLNERVDSKRMSGKVPYKDICGKCGATRVDRQMGLEKTPEEFISKMVEVFREVRRVLRNDGTLWLNMGDSYSAERWSDSMGTGLNAKGKNQNWGGFAPEKKSGLPPKNLVGMPWQLALALQADGWYLRSDIIWAKPNPMPESVKDRPTKSHEYIFLMSKSPKYYYDNEAVKEPFSNETAQKIAGGNAKFGTNKAGGYGNRRYSGKDYTPNMSGSGIDGLGRNKRDVWTVATQPFPEAHFATFPEKLVEPCVIAGCPKDGVVLDPFFGSGTTGVVAFKNGRDYLGIELSEEYIKIAERRLSKVASQESLLQAH